MTRIKDIIRHLESVAPLSYQESYDNSGLLVGDFSAKVKGILITLDVTEKVIEEAKNNGDNLIIAHHPIIFKGLKSLTGKNYVERTVIEAIKNDIAIYAIHTNLDNVINGVNKAICNRLELINCKILSTKNNLLSKLTTFVPVSNSEKVKNAMFLAGAGDIGNYSNCSFSVMGEGQFKPNENANPAIGTKDNVEKVEEIRIEVLVNNHNVSNVINSLKNAHPYEEVAYYLNSLENENQGVGSGMIGELKNKMRAKDFLLYLKEKMNSGCVRYTASNTEYVSKIAVCGGSGAFLLPYAKRHNADVFVTADFKYHEFFDAENQIIIADIGHYESEQFTKELIHDILNEKFTNFALNLSNTVTNPISYL